MSTPPPPSQPPSGGFGAPQDPPPGGFGGPPPVPPVPLAKPSEPPRPPAQPPSVPAQPPTVPTGQPAAAPPAAPAVPGPPAAPGAPPAAPAGQPGYGYPQAGYGQPQPQPVTAPMYAAQAPAGPAAGSGGNDVRNQLMIVGAALLAIALIIGGGFWYVSDDGDGGGEQPVAEGSASPGAGGDKGQSGAGGSEKVPASIKSKTFLNVPEPESADIVQIKGSWVTDTTYVKSDVGKVVGYKLTDGSKAWETPLKGNICGASRYASDNKAAILFDEAMPTAEKKYPSCNQAGVIDLLTGKLLWSASAKSQTGGDKPVRFEEITLSGQTVAAGGTGGGAAWNLADGKALWEPKTDAEGCEDMGYGGGPALAVIRKCGSSTRVLYAQALDPVTGAAKFSYKLPAGVEFAQIASTKPLIVAVNINKTAKDATGVSDLFVLDDAGALKTRIPLTSGNYAPRCSSTEVEDCTHMVVGNGKIYMPSQEHQGAAEYGRTNEIVSFDLETGKQTADRSDAGERFKIFPIRMDGPNLIAYKVPPYDGGGQIVSIEPKGMKQTVLMQNPATKESQRAETQFVPDRAEYLYQSGRLFIAATSVMTKSSVAGDPNYIVVSFKTG
ncbi:PQQ-binding-like beta-propeller repeat protein [Streptomyces sp. 4.24]|uniref:outer membrane protein assembly factor BamB family protein n=1 Tax=Streptomyces tritrimontium TaxID=3406573 RepID=UPI003BB74F7D